MVHQHTRTKVLEKLIESLQSAEKGSRDLDIIVSFVLGDTLSDAGKMIHLLVEEGYPWDVISELVDEDLAPYSTSLDAAVPGENIVMALYSPRRSKWAAVHRTPADKYVIVWAASECLARRAAADNCLSGPEDRVRQPLSHPGPRHCGNGCLAQPGVSRPHRY